MRGGGGAGGLFVAGLCAVGGGDTVRGGVLSEGGLWAGFGSRHAGWFLAGDAARFGGGMRGRFGYCNAAHFRVVARWLVSGWGARASGVACRTISGFVMPRASGPCIFGLHLRLGWAFGALRAFRGLCGRFAGEISGKWLTKVGKTAF